MNDLINGYIQRIAFILAAVLSITASAPLGAAESINPSQSIINKLEPARAQEKQLAPEFPTYSRKADLLQDIKNGAGLFFAVRELSSLANPRAIESEGGILVKNINIAFAKSVKAIIENDYGTPLTVSFDRYLKKAECGFAENLVSVSQSLLAYTAAVKLKKPDYLNDTSDYNINEVRSEFDKNLSRFRKCVMDSGNNFEPIGTLIGEMADALSIRVEAVKAQRREHLGSKLSEEFLVSQVIETDGSSASPGLRTSIEGFLEDLSKKASFGKWSVKGNSYTLSAKYNNEPLVIKMVHYPQKGATSLEGALSNKKLRAKEIFKLTKVVIVN